MSNEDECTEACSEMHTYEPGCCQWQLTQERLSEALKARAETTGGLMVGDKFTVDGYIVTIWEGSSPGQTTVVTVRIAPPPAPIGDHQSTTGFHIPLLQSPKERP